MVQINTQDETIGPLRADPGLLGRAHASIVPSVTMIASPPIEAEASGR